MSSDQTAAVAAALQNNPQNGAGRPLPKKEADIFKHLVKQYEMKQYKKAIKHADSILKKFPNHGETLAMKGLTYNYMTGHTRDEAHTLVKLGLKNDMRSHVCWHVYGLLHRSDHDYNEAIKAYKQALKFDTDNLQILRDLSMLQIQLRDYVGFTTTRNTLLTLKPNVKINWMAFALARHMSGDLNGAIHVIDIYLGTLTEGSSDLSRSYESSELAMYKNSIIAEIPNNFQAALDHLMSCESIVVDRGAWLRKRMEYQLKLQHFSDDRIQQTIYQLFDRGMTEDHTIHSLVMCYILQISDTTIIDEVIQLRGTQTLATYIPLSKEQQEIVYQYYLNVLQPRYPKSYATQRIPITLLPDDDDGLENGSSNNAATNKSFRYHIDLRCRKDIRRGVPSICSELKSYLWTVSTKTGRYIRTTDPIHIKHHPKYKIFVELIDSYIKNLESYSRYTAPSSDENGDSSIDEEEPSTLFWAWYVRAGLHEMVGEYVQGLQYIDKCIQHIPTAVDAYELKSLLLKLSGNINSAVQCIDYGRNMDRADRYLNNQTTKYMLQANMDHEALQRISMFTRHEGNPEQNLYDMQCSWYELELAECYLRQEHYGKSLKKYHAVIKHFHDFQEDQFDFHSYCLRKVTLRAYISVLRYEDIICGQEFYCQAAAGTIRIYLHLYDVPTSNVTEEPDYSKMDASERKKAKALARKKKKASEKPPTTTTSSTIKSDGGTSSATTSNGTATTTNAKSSTKGSGGSNNKLAANVIIDEDPLGLEYLKKDPLEEAKKYVVVLTKYAPQNLDSWILQYDVSVRRKKPLLAIQALYKAIAIDETSSEVFTRIVDFTKTLSQYTSAKATDDCTNGTSLVVNTVLESLASDLVQKLPVHEYILNVVQTIKTDQSSDLSLRIAVVKALIETSECNYTIANAVQELLLINDGCCSCCIETARNVSYETCRMVLDVLQSYGTDAKHVTDIWEVEYTKRFPVIPLNDMVLSSTSPEIATEKAD